MSEALGKRVDSVKAVTESEVEALLIESDKTLNDNDKMMVKQEAASLAFRPVPAPGRLVFQREAFAGLVNMDFAVGGADGRDHGEQFIMLVRIGKTLLIIPGSYIPLIGKYPDLEKFNGLILVHVHRSTPVASL